MSLKLCLVITSLLACCVDRGTCDDQGCLTLRNAKQRGTGPSYKAVTPHALHGEGPHWDSVQEVLLYVDISEQKVLKYHPLSGEVTHLKISTGPVSPVIPVKDLPDNFIVGVARDIVMVTWLGVANQTIAQGDSGYKVLATVDNNEPENRFNDGKADSKGRLWFGTMGPEKVVGEVSPLKGSLYRINSDLKPSIKISSVTVSNGLAWTEDDKTFYYIDSPTRKIDAFDFDSQLGEIRNRRTVYTFPENITGVPDGMTIDTEGNLWIAVFNGGRVLHVDPRAGKLIASYCFPMTRVTAVTFGGRHLDELFVTTSRLGLTEEEMLAQPLAGRVVQISGLGVNGRKANEFHLKNELL